MDFLTPELFDVLIIGNMIVGLSLAGVRFYRDMTRPFTPREEFLQALEADTNPGLRRDVSDADFADGLSHRDANHD